MVAKRWRLSNLQSTMNRRETLRLLGYLGIKAFDCCTAKLGDWCIWSEFPENIGNRLTNNERRFGDRDLYVSVKDKKRIEAEYERLRKQNKAKSKIARNPHRLSITARFHIDIIDFI